jgi:hypothetical protein
MLYIAAKMPEYCAAAGFVLAIICSLVAGIPTAVGLTRAIWAMGAFGLFGVLLGSLMAGVLSGGRREERRGAPPK